MAIALDRGSHGIGEVGRDAAMMGVRFRAGLGRLVLAFLMLLPAACGQPVPYNSVPTLLTPQPPGTARLIFYRPFRPYDSLAETPIYLNGTTTGISKIGTYLYRDIAPGQYDLAVRSPRSYPDQFKTVVVKPGDVFFVKVDTMPKIACSLFPNDPCYADTFIVTVVDPAVASYEMRGLNLVPG